MEARNSNTAGLYFVNGGDHLMDIYDEMVVLGAHALYPVDLATFKDSLRCVTDWTQWGVTDWTQWAYNSNLVRVPVEVFQGTEIGEVFFEDDLYIMVPLEVVGE